MTVTSGDSQKSFEVDQTKSLPSGEPFRQVATVALKADVETAIQVTNAATKGFLILDAVQLLPVETGEKY